VAQSGYPDVEAIQWVRLLTIAGTPPAIVERLNAEVNRAPPTSRRSEFSASKQTLRAKSRFNLKPFRSHVTGRLGKKWYCGCAGSAGGCS